MSDKTALLVIDVQRVYMEPDPMVTVDGDDLISKCRGLIERARAADVPVIFVRHVSDEQPNDPALVGIHPDLAPKADEPVIEKRFGSAFFRTDLTATLDRLDAHRLVIAGLATFGCVNATVMCAVCKEYDVVVASDAHGTVSSGESTPGEIIAHFNRAWEVAGAKLCAAAEIGF